MRSSRVLLTSASAELFTARSGSSSACMAGERVSKAAYMSANIVSPPAGGTSRARSIVAIGGSSRYAVSECQMPPKLWRSSGSLVTAMMSGWPGSPGTNG